MNEGLGQLLDYTVERVAKSNAQQKIVFGPSRVGWMADSCRDGSNYYSNARI